MTENTLAPYFRQIDTLWQAGLGRLTLGISPAGASGVFYAWGAHLAQAPGKMLDIALHPLLQAPAFAHRMTCARGDSCAADPRFRSTHWEAWPWRFYAESFLQMEEWWQNATTNVSGLNEHAENAVSFAVRQVMDALCPANFPVTNPDLALATLNSGGKNLWQGATNALGDVQRLLTNAPPEDEKFKVGQNIAVTPGDVVLRNNLIELIRYAPRTAGVYREPVLILPAWIMKYYILDLSPENSLVRWLVGQGHTVYMVSWKNPGGEDRNLGMDDYYRQGAMAAIDAVAAEFPRARIHLAGYCLGGTLALITAAAMAQRQDRRLKSLSLFAAQGDFREAGELMLFASHSQVDFLKNMMEVQGYLDPKQMAGAFQMLRSYDLIWSKAVNDYFKGLRRDAYDLTAWNADATRMPCKMHSEYLDKLFLHNDFAEGRYKVEGKTVAPENIRLPIFAVGTEKDHVAPWRSVHKIHLMVNGDITFVLAAGGHNAGIVSEPGHAGRAYRLLETRAGAPYVDPDLWLAQAQKREGSWWESWGGWLQQRSTAEQIAPPPPKARLGPAPGRYVFQK